MSKTSREFENMICGTCPRCGSVCDYGCMCPNGDPEFPLVKYDDQRAAKARSSRRQIGVCEAYGNPRCVGECRDPRDCSGTPLPRCSCPAAYTPDAVCSCNQALTSA